MYLNKAIIIGNLTREPEMRALPSGIQVCSFSVATNRVWKDKEGNKKEQADFHNIVVFGRQAETAGQYLKKGQSVLVEGRIQTRSWDDKEGSKKYRTEIVADRVQFGPKAGAAPSGGGGSYGGSKSDAGGSSGPAEPAGGIEYPTDEINPEDIPF
ncbi:MAG: single-stranded DNA-binding protein [Candidatus Taylorbacteria bacterium]|nr:single-stranded DNA-binding protein [Candidatus Taylorbacteria bacterium]